MGRFSKRAFLLSASLIISSCAGSGGGPLGIGAVIGDRNLAAAEPLFSSNEESCMGSADKLLSTIFGSAVTVDSAGRHADPCIQIRANFQTVLNLNVPPGTKPRYDVTQRNEIIDALIAASNRKCTRYTALLKNADGAMNAGLSVGSIITGGLGSIVGGAGAAKALAGTSSILSGSRAALNETYLTNQTIHVLAAAFEKARRAQRREITNRQACAADQYTLMRGIEDAFEYHQSCSIVVGLAETARSIERSENPGVEAMRLQFREMAALRQQAAELAKASTPTPVSGPPTPASLDKLVAADQALTVAAGALTAAQNTETAAKGELANAKNALAAQVAADKSAEQAAVAAAEKKVATEGSNVLKLTDARDRAARVRNAEVEALVRATAPNADIVEPETRACPFQVAVK